MEKTSEPTIQLGSLVNSFDAQHVRHWNLGLDPKQDAFERICASIMDSTEAKLVHLLVKDEQIFLTVGLRHLKADSQGKDMLVRRA